MFWPTWQHRASGLEYTDFSLVTTEFFQMRDEFLELLEKGALTKSILLQSSQKADRGLGTKSSFGHTSIILHQGRKQPYISCHLTNIGTWAPWSRAHNTAGRKMVFLKAALELTAPRTRQSKATSSGNLHQGPLEQILITFNRGRTLPGVLPLLYL